MTEDADQSLTVRRATILHALRIAASEYDTLADRSRLDADSKALRNRAAEARNLASQMETANSIRLID